jgi:uncharacterized delta-60 repeat protein
LEPLEDRAVPAAAGTLDPTFGTNGTVIFAVKQSSANHLFDIAVQDDGKIIAAGRTRGDVDGQDSVVTRFNADGSLDTSFGSNGSRLVSFGNSEEFHAVAIQSDGKIVAGGGHGGGTFTFARFNTDGSLDATFGAGGMLVLPVLGSGGDQLMELTIQPDGKIVGVGEVDGDLGLVRLNPNGSLDTTFGSGGAVATPIGRFARLHAVALQSDGKIVAAGNRVDVLGSNLLAIVRYNTNGSLDTSFDGDGIVRTGYGPNISDDIEGLALQTDGKIVVAGRVGLDFGGSNDFAVMRLNSNGSRDTAFGTNGVAFSNYSGFDNARDVLIQPDGKLIVVGSAGSPENSLIARLNADGTRDTTFGTEPSLGRTILNLRETDGDGFREAHFQNGKIVVGGFHGAGGASEQFFTLARFEPGGTPPTAEAGGPYTVDEEASVQLDASGSTDPDQPAGTLGYAWDLDGDGVFGETGAGAAHGDEVGITPTFSAAGIDGPDLVTVTLRVTDDDGLTSTDTASISVNNVAPTVAIAGPINGVPGQSRTFTFSAADVSPADQAGAFTFHVDWEGDGTFEDMLSGTSTLIVEHVFTGPGAFTVKATATDDDDGVSAVANHSINIVPAMLQSDPVDGALTALFAGGTNGDDLIEVRRDGMAGNYRVDVNGVFQGSFQPSGRIIVYGIGGNDTIDVASNVTSSAILFGDDGNDTLLGGGGGNILMGGAGNDSLRGGAQRDLLIGGTGADTLQGKNKDDLLIAGVTAHDANLLALDALWREWSRTDANYTDRILHLTGATGGGLNGSFVLNAGTVFDDSAVDTLQGDANLDFFFANLTGSGVLDVIADLGNQESVFEL